MTDASQVYISQRALQAAGQPISKLMGMALTNPNIISLAAGFVDNQSLPTEITRHAATKVLADNNGSKVALQYGSNHGDSELRRSPSWLFFWLVGWVGFTFPQLNPDA